MLQSPLSPLEILAILAFLVTPGLARGGGRGGGGGGTTSSSSSSSSSASTCTDCIGFLWWNVPKPWFIVICIVLALVGLYLLYVILTWALACISCLTCGCCCCEEKESHQPVQNPALLPTYNTQPQMHIITVHGVYQPPIHNAPSSSGSTMTFHDHNRDQAMKSKPFGDGGDASDYIHGTTNTGQNDFGPIPYGQGGRGYTHDTDGVFVIPADVNPPQVTYKPFLHHRQGSSISSSVPNTPKSSGAELGMYPPPPSHHYRDESQLPVYSPPPARF